MGRLAIMAGGFGSGKSEVALNISLQWAGTMDRVTLADLDLVNPYFASRDVRTTLEEAGIRLIAPSGELSFGDVPSIPGEIIGLLRQDNNMLIDVAGDEVGSMVLGYLSQYIIARQGYEFFLVLNPFRPFAQDIASVLGIRTMLEKAAKIKFTGVISNPNLLDETNVEVIRRGHELVLDFGRGLGLPVVCLTVAEEFYAAIYSIYGEMVRPIKLYLRPQWL